MDPDPPGPGLHIAACWGAEVGEGSVLEVAADLAVIIDGEDGLRRCERGELVQAADMIGTCQPPVDFQGGAAVLFLRQTAPGDDDPTPQAVDLPGGWAITEAGGGDDGAGLGKAHALIDHGGDQGSIADPQIARYHGRKNDKYGQRHHQLQQGVAAAEEARFPMKALGCLDAVLTRIQAKVTSVVDRYTRLRQDSAQWFDMIGST